MSANQNNLTPETTAAEYLTQRLAQAQKTHTRTRLVGSVLLFAVATYAGVATYMLTGFLEPDQAAQVTSGLITQHVEASAPLLTSKVEQELPALLHQTPDYLKARLPELRAQLSLQLEHEFRAYCDTLSRNLGDKMDKFIDDHQVEIKALIEHPDRDNVRRTLPGFDALVTDFVQNDVNGRELKQHIDDLAKALKEVEARMNRLANASDLTPEEHKARRALALVTKVASAHAAPLDLTGDPEEDDAPARRIKHAVTPKAAPKAAL